MSESNPPTDPREWTLGVVETADHVAKFEVGRHVCGECEHDLTNGFVWLSLTIDGEFVGANLTQDEAVRAITLMADAVKDIQEWVPGSEAPA